MKGAALIYRPGQAQPERTEFNGAIPIEFLQGAVGGYIEVVPGFFQIRVGDHIEACVAFCNEEGKLDGLPFNATATIEWEHALPTGLRNPQGEWLDWLVGAIVVVFGDADFMADL